MCAQLVSIHKLYVMNQEEDHGQLVRHRNYLHIDRPGREGEMGEEGDGRGKIGS